MIVPTIQPTVIAPRIETAHPFDGANIVNNGRFDTDLSGWTAGTGWAPTGSGAAVYNGNPGGVEVALSQTLTT